MWLSPMARQTCRVVLRMARATVVNQAIGGKVRSRLDGIAVINMLGCLSVEINSFAVVETNGKIGQATALVTVVETLSAP